MREFKIIYDRFFMQNVQKRFEQIREWPEDHHHIKNHFKHLSEFTEILPEWSVLDVGSRDAWSCLCLEKEHGIKECIGLEVLPHYVKHYRELGRNIIQGDACDLSRFKESVFDFILCRHVLGLVRNPAQALFEMTRVAKPGGYLYIVLGIPGNKRLHYVCIEKKSDVQEWVAGLKADILFFDVNPNRLEEYSLILKVRA